MAALILLLLPGLGSVLLLTACRVVCSPWPEQTPGIKAGADGLARFIAGQAGAFGPQQECVIVERVHSISVGSVTRWEIACFRAGKCVAYRT